MILEQTRFSGVATIHSGIGVIHFNDGEHDVFGASCEEDVDAVVQGQYAYHDYVCGYEFLLPDDKNFDKYKEMM